MQYFKQIQIWGHLAAVRFNVRVQRKVQKQTDITIGLCTYSTSLSSMVVLPRLVCEILGSCLHQRGGRTDV